MEGPRLVKNGSEGFRARRATPEELLSDGDFARFMPLVEENVSNGNAVSEFETVPREKQPALLTALDELVGKTESPSTVHLKQYNDIADKYAIAVISCGGDG